MEKMFCINCGKVIENYNVIDKNMDIELKGDIYHFLGKEAVCPDCGEPIFSNEVLRINKERAYQAFREANDIISLSEILSIPEKYHISKRNISKYLGWGEVTFSRYCSGYIPTKHNSAILLEVLNNPEYLIDKIKKYISDNPDDKNAQRDLQKVSQEIQYDAIIEMYWDNDSNTWIATSTDIPGLVLKSCSFDELMERVKSTIPELLNRSKSANGFVLEFQAKRKEMILV